MNLNLPPKVFFVNNSVEYWNPNISNLKDIKYFDLLFLKSKKIRDLPINSFDIIFCCTICLFMNIDPCRLQRHLLSTYATKSAWKTSCKAWWEQTFLLCILICCFFQCILLLLSWKHWRKKYNIINEISILIYQLIDVFKPVRLLCMH